MKHVGKSYQKIDGKGLISGRPAYTDDIAPLNCLVIKVLRSPHAFARILSIDVSEAKALAGVEYVLTHHDVPRTNFTRAGQGYPEPSPYDKFILDEYVRYSGDEVAAVAAVDERTALDALSLIKVEYEVFEPVLDFETAIGHKSVIHPEAEVHSMFEIGLDAKQNIAAGFDMHIGDVDAVLSKCDVVVSDTFYTHAQAHAAMETHTCSAYTDLHGRLVVTSSTQTPFHVRRILGSALGIPRSSIRVIKPRVGGGYGGKQQLHGELIASLIALRTKKPVKLVYTRKEVFESSYCRHQMRIDVSLGANKTGEFKAIDMKILSNTGAYGEHALTVFMVAGSKSLPLYNKVDAVRFGGKIVYTNLTPAGAYRGYGAIQANFALESVIDMVADKLGIDPIELRKQNAIQETETSPIFKVMGEGTEGVEMFIDTCKLEYCMNRGMELSGWKNRKFKEKISETKVRGFGTAIAMQGSGIPYIDMAAAILKLNDDGFFNLMLGATDIGTGSDTILAQIAAEELGVNFTDIRVYSSDTDLTPFDTGAYASSTTYVTGNAVRSAAIKMKQEIINEAAGFLNVSAETLEFDGEFVKETNGTKKIALKDFSTNLYYNHNQKQLATVGSYVGHKSPPPYMAGFAEVEIDIETGKVELVNYTAVVDCGTPINPNLCRVQVEGGLAQGIGMTLFEEVKHTDKGVSLTNSFMTYKTPSRLDLNNIIVEFAQCSDPTGPFGAKSVGEIGIDTPPAAIANAIYNAVGVRIKTLPITAEKVLTEINKELSKK